MTTWLKFTFNLCNRRILLHTCINIYILQFFSRYKTIQIFLKLPDFVLMDKHIKNVYSRFYVDRKAFIGDKTIEIEQVYNLRTNK